MCVCARVTSCSEPSEEFSPPTEGNAHSRSSVSNTPWDLQHGRRPLSSNAVTHRDLFPCAFFFSAALRPRCSGDRSRNAAATRILRGAGASTRGAADSVFSHLESITRRRRLSDKRWRISRARSIPERFGGDASVVAHVIHGGEEERKGEIERRNAQSAVCTRARQVCRSLLISLSPSLSLFRS